MSEKKEWVVRLRITVERELIVIGTESDVNKNPYNCEILSESGDLEMIDVEVINQESNE